MLGNQNQLLYFWANPKGSSMNNSYDQPQGSPGISSETTAVMLELFLDEPLVGIYAHEQSQEEQ